MKERKTWRANGAFENVEMAEKGLEATRKGESLGGVFAQQRKELEKTKKPRKNVMRDMEEGNGGEADDGKQKVVVNGEAGPGVKENSSVTA